jgi:hypothetical protein
MRPLTSAINRPSWAPMRRGWIVNCCLTFRAAFCFCAKFPFLPRWSSITFNYQTPNIRAHHLCAQVNTHEMPPKKKPGKELSVDGPSQSIRAPTHETTQTTTQPPSSSEPQEATAKVERPDQPSQQPPNQAEVLAMNTSVQTTQHPNQLQNTEAQEDQNKILKKRSKQSSRMSWRASARRLSVCTSC